MAAEARPLAEELLKRNSKFSVNAFFRNEPNVGNLGSNQTLKDALVSSGLPLDVRWECLARDACPESTGNPFDQEEFGRLVRRIARRHHAGRMILAGAFEIGRALREGLRSAVFPVDRDRPFEHVADFLHIGGYAAGFSRTAPS